MAENKNTFILFTKYIHIFDGLTDEEAGRLIKHLFRYVNDQNPTAPDRLTEAVFESIKHDLKEHLKKWEKVIEKKSEAGKLGGIKSGKTRALKAKIKSQNLEFEAKESNEAFASNYAKIEANEAVNVYVNNISIGRNDLEKSILEFFGFNEMPHNYTHQTSIFGFCTVQKNAGNLQNFAQQFTDYCEYLKASKNMKFRMSLNKFLGDQSESFKNGKWNSENWSDKLKILNLNSITHVKGAIDQSNNKDFLK